MAQNKGGKIIQMLSPENYIRKKVRTLPILECLVNDDWEISQMVQLSVARQHTNGNVTVCFFLVDLLCLGVKDTHYIFNAPLLEYRRQIEMINEKMSSNPASYELVHNIVYAGIEFADEYGFKPHKDFNSITRFMLEEDTEDIELIEIECGMNQKPVYSRGPNDDDVKVTRILAQLEKTAGRGNYIYMDGEGFDEDEFDENDDEDEFSGMTFDEKKEMFLNQSARMDKLTEKETREFSFLVDSLIHDLTDHDLIDQYYDELFEELDIETFEEEVPDELLGILPGSQMLSSDLRSRFVKIFEMIIIDRSILKREFAKFKRDAPDIPGNVLLELLIIQDEKPSIYSNRLNELTQKYPNYQLLKTLWIIEQIATKKSVRHLQGFPFKLENLYPNRVILHWIEKYYGLLVYVFELGLENDLNKLEAFEAVISDSDLSEYEEDEIMAMIFIIKTNILLAQLKE